MLRRIAGRLARGAVSRLLGGSSATPDKIKFIIGKGQGKRFRFNENDRSSVINVCLNPTEYSITTSNSFKEAKVPGLDAPIIQPNQGNPSTLDLELLLDTYLNDDTQKKDVRKEYIEKFEKLLDIDSELHAPPPCRIVWGSLHFDGVLENMDKKYVLFDKEGKPVRVRLTLKFKEYFPLEMQVKKASTSSPDRRKVFTVKEGDRIWEFADRAYGDAALWRLIAEANHIDDPKELEVGRDLIIPVLTQ
jgi:hypothetical protein